MRLQVQVRTATETTERKYYGKLKYKGLKERTLFNGCRLVRPAGERGSHPGRQAASQPQEPTTLLTYAWNRLRLERVIPRRLMHALL